MSWACSRCVTLYRFVYLPWRNTRLRAALPGALASQGLPICVQAELSNSVDKEQEGYRSYLLDRLVPAMAEFYEYSHNDQAEVGRIPAVDPSGAGRHKAAPGLTHHPPAGAPSGKVLQRPVLRAHKEQTGGQGSGEHDMSVLFQQGSSERCS